jgi:hypothetical protein
MLDNVVQVRGVQVRTKHLIVRIPTIIFTIVMFITLGLYFLVNVICGSTLDVPNFIMLAFMETTSYLLYYPDGQLKGQASERYLTNKENYNTNANKVNKKRQNRNLQDYCVYEYKQRIQEYIETQLGYCDLNYNDYLYLKDRITEKELKRSKYVNINGEEVYLSKASKKILYRLLFKKMPVKANTSKMMLSAVESRAEASIRDKSKRDKALSDLRMIIKIGAIAYFSGYMIVTTKAFTFETVVQMVMDLTSILVVIVLSYYMGEKNQRVYKADFYMELSQFLENFFEWLLYDKNIDIETFEPKSLLLSKESKVVKQEIMIKEPSEN